MRVRTPALPMLTLQRDLGGFLHSSVRQNYKDISIIANKKVVFVPSTVNKRVVKSFIGDLDIKNSDKFA